MAITLDDIEDTLNDYEEWKGRKANPGPLDISMQAYLKELVAVKNASDLAEIRSIMEDIDQTERQTLDRIEAVLSQDG